jgi:hypothetical protein
MLLNSINLKDDIFTGNINALKLKKNNIHHLAFILNQLESPITSLAFMINLYKQNNIENSFLYYIGLAEAGVPWKLLQYSEWIFKKVKPGDDSFCFLLKAFALIRQKNEIKKYFNEILELLDQIQGNYPLVLNEKLKLYLRQNKFDLIESTLNEIGELNDDHKVNYYL